MLWNQKQWKDPESKQALSQSRNRSIWNCEPLSLVELNAFQQRDNTIKSFHNWTHCPQSPHYHQTWLEEYSIFWERRTKLRPDCRSCMASGGEKREIQPEMHSCVAFGAKRKKYGLNSTHFHSVVFFVWQCGWKSVVILVGCNASPHIFQTAYLT